MANVYSNYTTTEPQAVSVLKELQPFDGDTESTVLEQDFEVDATRFERIPLDQSHPDRPDHYLVRESDPVDIGQGNVRFTRTWARIPNPREEPETYPYTVPGVETLGAFAAINVSSAVTAGGLTTITTSGAHGFSVGDGVLVQYTVTFASGAQAGRQTFRLATTGTTGSTLNVAQVADSGTIYWPGAKVMPPPGREPYTVAVPSTIIYDYFLPGVSTGIARATDIPTIQAFTIIGADGNRTESLSATTTPTVTEYRAMVAAGTRIAAEASSSRRWMGNIHERATRYVTAI